MEFLSTRRWFIIYLNLKETINLCIWKKKTMTFFLSIYFYNLWFANKVL